MIVNRFDIPGYSQAVERENQEREAAFVNPLTLVCGIAIRQLTPRDGIILEGLGSPFIVGGNPTWSQIMEFLWRMSPDYSRSNLKRHLFDLRCWRLRRADTLKPLDKYIERTFQDAPGQKSGASQKVPFAGWPAYIIDPIASEYGWGLDVILNTPYRVLYQLLNCITKRYNADAIIFNPSDKVKGEYLRLKNARLQLVNTLARRAAKN